MIIKSKELYRSHILIPRRWLNMNYENNINRLSLLEKMKENDYSLSYFIPNPLSGLDNVTLEAYHRVSEFDEPLRVLGVAVNATKEEIKSAYRTAMKLLHPDTVQNPELKEKLGQLTQKINTAYELFRERS